MAFPSEHIARQRAEAYSTAHGFGLTERLGFGKDGTVWSTTRLTAIKVHYRIDTWTREFAAFGLLGGNTSVAGFAVPALVGFDRGCLVLEMSIVGRPFVLDFAHAYSITQAPDFPEEVMEQWLSDKREEFGKNWPAAAMLIHVLRRDFGLVMTDVHPGNIAF